MNSIVPFYTNPAAASVRCRLRACVNIGGRSNSSAEAPMMKLTDWLVVIPTVQNPWTFAALLAVLIYLYASRRDKL
jgi:hypothetical protein